MAERRGALAIHRADVSRRKQLDVLAAIDSISRQSSEITVALVASTARVSREFIYSHQHLRAAIQKAVDRAENEAATDVSSQRRVSEAGLRTNQTILAKKITELREQLHERDMQIAELGRQRESWLGAQLEAFSANPVEVAELRATVDRLTTSNALLETRLSESAEVNRGIANELAGSREAHREDIARLTGGTISQLRPEIRGQITE